MKPIYIYIVYIFETKNLFIMKMFNYFFTVLVLMFSITLFSCDNDESDVPQPVITTGTDSTQSNNDYTVAELHGDWVSTMAIINGDTILDCSTLPREEEFVVFNIDSVLNYITVSNQCTVSALSFTRDIDVVDINMISINDNGFELYRLEILEGTDLNANPKILHVGVVENGGRGWFRNGSQYIMEFQ